MNPFALVAPALAAVALANPPSLPSVPPIPKDNPISAAKVELGRKLFFDPRLSRDGTVSCNSCHNVMSGGDDSRAHSAGVKGQLGGRSAPTVWNAAYYPMQFWDGRAASLEEQAKGPLVNPVEMSMESHDLVVSRIREIPGYVAEFEKAFGRKDSISIDAVAKAIASYERTLITPNSAFDRFVRGDKKALSAEAQRGWKLAQSIGCVSCHQPPLFSSPAYQKFPLIPNEDLEKEFGFMKDAGRYEVTKQEADKHMYKVPTWRNVALTAPYFHNGSVKSLTQAIQIMGRTQLNRGINETEARDIASFLEALSGPFPNQPMPRLPGLSGRTLLAE